MADTTNSNRAADATNGKCGLFKLPLEVRQIIYRYCFADFRFHLIASPHQYIKDNPANAPRHNYFIGSRKFACLTTNQWKLLKVCRQTYHEGRAILWEETIMSIDWFPRFQPEKFFSLALSDFTRAHVGHLRDIQVISERDELPKLLDYFPKVSTLQLTEFDLTMHPNDYATLESKTLLGILENFMPSSEEVFEDNELSPYLNRVTILYCFFAYQAGKFGCKRCFVNLNTGKCFVSNNHCIDREEGLARVLN